MIPEKRSKRSTGTDSACKDPKVLIRHQCFSPYLGLEKFELSTEIEWVFLGFSIFFSQIDKFTLLDSPRLCPLVPQVQQRMRKLDLGS
jgi:hypothetical protein